MPQETWSSRDKPVLEAIVELTDEGRFHISPSELAERTGLQLERVQLALVALAGEWPPFFEFTDCTSGGSKIRELDMIRNPSGHARRTVKTWPTPEALADRVIAGLQEAANATEDEEEASRLRRTGQWFGSAGRDVLVNVIGSAMGGG